MEARALRYLGLDVGDRRIGVAVSDPSGIVITPLMAIERSEQYSDILGILALLDSYDVGGLVVGLPLSLNGSEGRQARIVRIFIRALGKESPVGVYVQDERFSTVEAGRLLRASGQKPSYNKAHRDSASAAVILRGFLDSQNRDLNRFDS